MSDENSKSSLSLPFLFILFISLGYFTYNGVDGLIAIAILDILLSISLLVSLIPFAGFILQYCIITMWIFPFVFELTGIYPTYLTTIMLVVYMIIGVIITFVTTLYALSE